MQTKLAIRRWLGVTLCGAVVTLSSCWAAAQYQESSLNEVTTVRGKVSKETTNPPGDVDGWVMEDGTAVHFPPHAYDSIQDWIKPGDAIVVQTTPKTDPEGRKIQEVVTIQKGDRTITIEPPRPPRGGPGRGAPRGERPDPGRERPDARNERPVPRAELPFEREEPMKLSGKVTGFHENPHGDVDGIFLDDDTEVKFPPHMSREIQDAVAVGDTITAEGKRHITPKGDLHLRADVITAKNESIEIDHPKGPKPPKDHGPQEDWMTKKQADEMISELRAIRKLLENKS